MKPTSAINLKTRAILVTGGILLLAMLLNTLVTTYVAKNRYQDALIGRTTALAEGIQKDIRKAVGFGLSLSALEGMGDKLRSLMEEDRELSYAMIMDAGGKVLHASDRPLENTTPGDEASRNALAANEPKVQYVSDQKGGHYEKVIPLSGPDGKKIGVLRIALKEEAVGRQVRSLLSWSLLVGLISFVIAVVLVSLFMDRGIIRPITQMSKTAAVMAAGDLSREIPTTGRDEIADLGGAINAMSANLREMLRKVRTAGVALDGRQSRTTAVSAERRRQCARSDRARPAAAGTSSSGTSSSHSTGAGSRRRMP